MEGRKYAIEIKFPIIKETFNKKKRKIQVTLRC